MPRDRPPKQIVAQPAMSDTDWLMQPFLSRPGDGVDDDLLDIIQETILTLRQKDQDTLASVFYLRETFQETAATLGIKAKSHAFRRNQSALAHLKVALLSNERFIELTGTRYTD